MEKVTLILPCYNVEDYIEKCINSLSNQSYASLEIIAVDDGSKDNTLKKLYKLKKIENRLIVYEQKNKGVSAARNLAIDNASGDFIIFIDPDDYVHKDFVLQLVNSLKINDAGLAVCGHTKIYKNGLEEKSKAEENLFIGDQIIEEYFLGTSPLTVLMCDKIFLTNIIKTNKIYCPVEVTSGQDQVFILEYLMHVNKVVTINNNYYYYYQRVGSKSKRYEFYIFEKTIVKLLFLKKILIENNKFIKYRKNYEMRMYMNLFSQGFLSYKNNNNKEFFKSFIQMRNETIKFVGKKRYEIFFDILLNKKFSIQEKIACIVTYFTTPKLSKYLYRYYYFKKGGI
ncbi:glycosyltransferase family 2 protein [Exiguobacterium sp. s91]|uniref:glycosyltransferase family 2 protein n=1 Tax=Exiguobacterium sp. s91 TaxID=2751199 RepID=UPI001BE92BCD